MRPLALLTVMIFSLPATGEDLSAHQRELLLARLEDLAGSHEQHARSIGRVIARLEQQISTALESLTAADPKADDRAGEIEDRLGELKAQVVAVCDRIDHDVAPALAALQRSDDDASIGLAVADLPPGRRGPAVSAPMLSGEPCPASVAQPMSSPGRVLRRCGRAHVIPGSCPLPV